MNKINVLQLITGLGMGGAEKVVLNLSKFTNKKEFNTYVVSMSKRDELYDEFIKEKINTTKLNKSNSFKDIISIIKSINKIIKEKKIHIIHAHMTHSIIVASILKILNPKIKIVFTSHSLKLGSRLRELIISFFKPLRNIDIIFSKDILRYFYKSSYRILPNGIEIEKYVSNQKKNNKFTFISIGRLEDVKNHIYLIEFAKKLKNKHDFEIHIVGHGYLEEKLKKLIKINNLEKYIKLLGLRSDIPKLLNESHCLIMPSLWEGLPIVILEAGASSLPILSTPVGSIPSLLDKKNSYICELEDFVDNAELIINDYETAKEKGNKLFKKINNIYSISEIVKKHEEIYKELI